VTGLPGVGSEELVVFPDGLLGMAVNLDVDRVGVILLGLGEGVTTGTEVRRTGR
ncbi:MAG: F0F1 ATP synthase subunit alpha, partial [Gammaproteobacteria bacterium]|nr:F0F1 ATP synthase subunit alpha [Gammaproteobacteria bacterium]NIR43259.1 F0F1 ATP synthase subunit alpha [Gemmatimonadota bacterium]NIR96579.1 F0F1 ATP synthase subunit alpha [Gammaproteobacteria bacterium]NIT62717.1 F0F1 ATP synthase subunit alpha [Gammaproteobacteria bacterium]NIV19675.1 F0F1 ATP synthase subunit alpha [Gammaproteobacteria bacterium]